MPGCAGGTTIPKSEAWQAIVFDTPTPGRTHGHSSHEGRLRSIGATDATPGNGHLQHERSTPVGARGREEALQDRQGPPQQAPHTRTEWPLAVDAWISSSRKSRLMSYRSSWRTAPFGVAFRAS